MGCCASSQSPLPIHYNTGGHHGDTSSQSPIIDRQPLSNIARPSTAQSTQPQSPLAPRRQKRQSQAPTGNPNANLIPLEWTDNNRQWTRREIDQERDDFFFTRVTGRQDVWQIIKTALEIVWAGGDAVDSDGGWGTAQAMLRAASITVPDGRMHRGAYDPQGAKYELPKFVICDPTNLVVEEENPVGDDGSKDEIGLKSEGESEERSEDEEVRLQRREEKGKGIAVEEIQVSARRSDGVSDDLVITAGRENTVKQLLRKFNQSGGVAPPKSIQLYYLGRKLELDKPLEEQGWRQGNPLQAFVIEAP